MGYRRHVLAACAAVTILQAGTASAQSTPTLKQLQDNADQRSNAVADLQRRQAEARVGAEKQLFTYAKASVAVLEQQGIKFEPTGSAISSIRYHAKTVGIGDVQATSSQNESVTSIEGIFSSVSVVVGMANDRFFVLTVENDWSNDNRSCSTSVNVSPFNNGVTDYVKADCNAFIQGRSTAAVNSLLERIVRKILSYKS